MSSYHRALLLLARPGVVIMIAALITGRRLNRLNREIAAQEAEHPAE